VLLGVERPDLKLPALNNPRQHIKHKIKKHKTHPSLSKILKNPYTFIDQYFSEIAKLGRESYENDMLARNIMIEEGKIFINYISF
jgi:hypothetical protein